MRTPLVCRFLLRPPFAGPAGARGTCGRGLDELPEPISSLDPDLGAGCCACLARGAAAAAAPGNARRAAIASFVVPCGLPRPRLAGAASPGTALAAANAGFAPAATSAAATAGAATPPTTSGPTAAIWHQREAPRPDPGSRLAAAAATRCWSGSAVGPGRPAASRVSVTQTLLWQWMPMAVPDAGGRTPPTAGPASDFHPRSAAVTTCVRAANPARSATRSSSGTGSRALAADTNADAFAHAMAARSTRLSLRPMAARRATAGLG